MPTSVLFMEPRFALVADGFWTVPALTCEEIRFNTDCKTSSACFKRAASCGFRTAGADETAGAGATRAVCACATEPKDIAKIPNTPKRMYFFIYLGLCVCF